MKFNIGDILSYMDNSMYRVVVSKDPSLQIYGLGFVNDPGQRIYKWTFESAHEVYKLYIPDYIPVEQHGMYRKMK